MPELSVPSFNTYRDRRLRRVEQHISMYPALSDKSLAIAVDGLYALCYLAVGAPEPLWRPLFVTGVHIAQADREVFGRTFNEDTVVIDLRLKLGETGLITSIGIMNGNPYPSHQIQLESDQSSYVLPLRNPMTYIPSEDFNSLTLRRNTHIEPPLKGELYAPDPNF